MSHRLWQKKKATRLQPRREIRTERLEQCIDTLTELVSTLVAAFGQNTANVAPAILPWIPLANAEGEEAPPPQKGRDATISEARTNTHVH